MVRLLTIFLLIGVSWAKSNHPIYEQILRNQPSIDRTYAMKLSNVIHKVCKKYRLPKHIYTAILAQESGYRLDAVGKATGLYKGNMTTVRTDFGISQIHWKNVVRLGLDVDRLLEDMVYSVESGAKILADFKRRYEHKEKDYWTRYNASNPIKRKIYKQLVERYL